MGIIYNFQDILLITCGAALGASTRYTIYKKLEKNNISKQHIILLINIFSSFLLGLFLAILSENSSLDSSYELGLFFSIGLLGSLSTFSSFIFDLYDFFVKFKFYKAFKLCFISITLGIAAFTVGFILGIL